MAKIYTFTKPGNKKPWLVYEDDARHDEVIATLRVSREEFFEKLGKALDIKFVEEASNETDNG